MPFFEVAVDSPNYHPNIVCPATSCKKGITQKQAVLMCTHCQKLYHPPCKGIIGAAKIKKAAESNWFCSPECTIAAVTFPEPPSINSPINTSIAPPCSTGSKCEVAITSLMKRIDDQFGTIKTLISDIKISQEFICKEFERYKREIKTLVAENKRLSDICQDLQGTCRKQDERLNLMESLLDKPNQISNSSKITIVGLPNKHDDILGMILATLTNVNNTIVADDNMTSFQFNKLTVAEPNSNQIKQTQQFLITFLLLH